MLLSVSMFIGLKWFENIKPLMHGQSKLWNSQSESQLSSADITEVHIPGFIHKMRRLIR